MPLFTLGNQSCISTFSCTASRLDFVPEAQQRRDEHSFHAFVLSASASQWSLAGQGCGTCWTNFRQKMKPAKTLEIAKIEQSGSTECCQKVDYNETLSEVQPPKFSERKQEEKLRVNQKDAVDTFRTKRWALQFWHTYFLCVPMDEIIAKQLTWT